MHICILVLEGKIGLKLKVYDGTSSGLFRYAVSTLSVKLLHHTLGYIWPCVSYLKEVYSTF
jgi:hypothetical protein